MWGARLGDLIGTWLLVRSSRKLTLSGILFFLLMVYVAGRWGYIPIEWLQSKGFLSKEFDSRNEFLALYLFGALGITLNTFLVLAGFSVFLAFITVWVVCVKMGQKRTASKINKLKTLEEEKYQLWCTGREHYQPYNFRPYLRKYWLQWVPDKKEQW